MSSSETEPLLESPGSDEAPAFSTKMDSVVIPVRREELDIRKQRVTTGTVQIRKVVHQRDEVVNEPATHNTVQIERVALNKVVDAPPAVRKDGATTIYSLVEEVVVVSRHYLLKEEVRVTEQVTQSASRQSVSLRSEEMHIERQGAVTSCKDPGDWSRTDIAFGAFEEGAIELRETTEEPVVSTLSRVTEEIVLSRHLSERQHTVTGSVRRTDVEIEEVGKSNT